MITRRNLMVALAAAGAPPQTAVLQSAAFDWNAIPAKETKVGSVRSFIKAPTATLAQLELHVTTLNPGQEPHPPHRHPNEEMVIVKEGTVEALVNGDWKRLGPGSVIFNASNQLHGLRNPGSVPATYHVINWATGATATQAN